VQPSDKLIIETPEQTTLEFPLAGIGSRSLALMIDTLLQIGALIILGIVAGLISYAGFFPSLGKQWVYAIFIFLAFLVEFAYFAFFEIVWNGQTPGKRWTRLRVITDSGRPLDVQSAILRNLVRIVDTLPSLYAAGIVTSLISSQNKRIGDYVAGTLVIHEKALQDVSPWAAPAASPLMTARPPELTSAQLQLVEAFLERRDSFPEDVRRSMAVQIVARLNQKSTAPQEALQTPEKFLEALAEQCRSAARFR
jgi:uncharacterized RDD family membrane protein YckC